MAASAKIGGHPLLSPRTEFVEPAVIAFMLAGLAGGVIASSITQKVGGSSLDFLEERIGFWDWKQLHFPGRIWTYIEHTSFWIGLVCAALSFC